MFFREYLTTRKAAEKAYGNLLVKLKKKRSEWGLAIVEIDMSKKK